MAFHGIKRDFWKDLDVPGWVYYFIRSRSESGQCHPCDFDGERTGERTGGYLPEILTKVPYSWDHSIHIHRLSLLRSEASGKRKWPSWGFLSSLHGYPWYSQPGQSIACRVALSLALLLKVSRLLWRHQWWACWSMGQKVQITLGSGTFCGFQFGTACRVTRLPLDCDRSQNST